MTGACPGRNDPRCATEVADKFRTNAGFAKWATRKTGSIIELVTSLENASTLAALTAALAT